MDDPDDLAALKQMTKRVVDLCTDFDTLDLVYKLLINDSCAAQ